MSTFRSSERPIPAFAPTSGGDDLGAARDFIDSAVAEMRTLHVEDAPAVDAWLDAVEDFALGLQARAIARSVARARLSGTPEQLTIDLSSIGSLIAQYEQGLVDVEAQLEAGEVVGEAEPLPVPSDVPAPSSSPGPDAQDRVRQGRFEQARATLAELLPIVDTHGHFDALESLVAFRPPVFEVPSELKTAPPRDDHRVDVDAFLPGLADHAQRMARLHGKPVTVSYASEDATLPATLLEEWRAAVETALTAVAETTLEPPAARRARGLALSAHIGLTARGTSDGVCLRITCPGRTAPRMVVDAPHTLDARSDDGTVVVEFTARATGARGICREGAA